MDAVGLNLGNRAHSNRNVINLMQSKRCTSFVAAQHQKVDFRKVCSYENIALRKQAGVLKVLQCRNSLPEAAFGGKGYYGLKVHKAVIASGARYSGPTVHFVDEHYDTGRIVAQKVVPVLANDTAEELAARVLREEHQVYVEVVSAVCEDRIVWREDGVPLIRSRENPDEYN